MGPHRPGPRALPLPGGRSRPRRGARAGRVVRALTAAHGGGLGRRDGFTRDRDAAPIGPPAAERGSDDRRARRNPGAFPADLVWSVQVDPARDGVTNMARDHALALALPPGRAVLRLYRWSAPTLSFGRNEPALGRWDRAGLARRGVDVVRRPTGGRAVLHWREVTYAVVAPLPDRGGLRAAYLAVSRALAAGLRQLGIDASIREEGRIAPLDHGPCFAAPAPGEVVSEGRKLVGSAQARLEGRLLQHGAVLLADDQGWVEDYRLAPDGSPGPGAGPTPPATLSGLLGRTPASDDVVTALAAGFARTLPGHWPRGARGGTLAWSTRPHEPALRERYASESWTWRR